MSAEQAKRTFGLTDREIQILRLAADGKRDKEIALDIGCAVSTVSNTLSRIYKKTGTGSRIELSNLISER
jgi:DNA-binding CsgD family transcriptional regulator